MAGEALFGKERADVGFESIRFFSDRALARGKGGEHPQVHDERSTQKQSRGQAPKATGPQEDIGGRSHGGLEGSGGGSSQ
jgi:hypothetical protein